MTDVYTWAMRWNLPPEALAELQALSAPPVPPVSLSATAKGASEAAVQSSIRLAGSAAGVTLFRNNSGVCFGVDDTDRGAPPRAIRYGLANDSKALNAQLKSPDLVGFTKSGQFLSVECKHQGWRWSGTDRERAQNNWHELVIRNGGISLFATSWEQVYARLR